MKICGIYSITNLVNGKRIIGQTKDIKDRFRVHKSRLRRNVHENDHLQKSWNKYGEHNFKFEVIVECLEKDLDKEEIRLIDLYHSNNPQNGYNMRRGGDRMELPLEARQKISLYRKGRKASEATKLKMSLAQTGTKNHNYGTILPPERRQKLSEGLKTFWSLKKNPIISI